MGNLSRGLLAAVVSGALTAGSAAIGLARQGWTVEDGLFDVLWPFGVGAGFGALVAALSVRFLLKRAETLRRFALALSVHAIFALAAILLLFGLQYRLYFSQWHAGALSFQWAVEVVFTLSGSAYLFLSTGLVLLTPWAILAWIGVALFLAQPLKRP